jgi:hypothetical protein
MVLLQDGSTNMWKFVEAGEIKQAIRHAHFAIIMQI